VEVGEAAIVEDTPLVIPISVTVTVVQFAEQATLAEVVLVDTRKPDVLLLALAAYVLEDVAVEVALVHIGTLLVVLAGTGFVVPDRDTTEVALDHRED